MIDLSEYRGIIWLTTVISSITLFCFGFIRTACLIQLIYWLLRCTVITDEEI